MDLDTLQTVLGWCLVINYALLLLWFAVFAGASQWIVGLHARMFGLEESTVRSYHFLLMGQYKLLVFVIVLAPWLALVIMGR